MYCMVPPPRPVRECQREAGRQSFDGALKAPPRGRGRGDDCGRGRVVPELKAAARAKGGGVAQGCKAAVLQRRRAS